VGQRLRGVGQRIAARVRRVGQRLRDRFGRRGRQSPGDRQRKDQERKERRLEAAAAALQGRLARGIPGWMMPLYLAYLRVRYRLTQASVGGSDQAPQINLVINPRKLLSARAKIEEKTVGGNATMFVMRGTPALDPRALELIAAAESFFKGFVLAMATADPHKTPQALGRDAGAATEAAVKAWATGRFGFATVKVGADFPAYGGVPVGLQAPYRVSRSVRPRSFDVTFPGGRLVIDLKLSPSATREDQKRVHLTFAYRKKMVLVYIYGT
jgi:hypothetical protein